MIGTGTGMCPPRAASPTRDRGRPVSPACSPMRTRVRTSSPRLSLSPRMSPQKPPEYSTLSIGNRSPTSSIRSPTSKAANRSYQSPPKGPQPVARRDGRVCLHADTAHNTSVYPNMVFDPEGEIIVSLKPTVFDMAALIQSQVGSLNKAGKACGLVVARNHSAKDPANMIRCGTFFQVSATRALCAFHTVCDGPAGRDPRPREIFLSKSCTINHWRSIFSYEHSRKKYFKEVKLVPGFLEERNRLLPYYGDNLTDKCSGLAPRQAIDLAVLDLGDHFKDDHYLKPLPKSKIRSVKKVAVISHNQEELRDENSRTNIYASTGTVPDFDQQAKCIHFGSKSISPGLLVGSNEAYVCSECTLGEGSAGGPLIPLTLSHYFWGIQICCFYDSEVSAQFGGPRSRNYNVQINFYHPAVLVLYEKYVIPTLPEDQQREIKSTCFFSASG